jgi:glycosyltransferase involved in cell wall biosynthesis
MIETAASPRRTLLLYEPRTEGHHLGWLRLIAEDLLSADFRLTLAVDLRPGTEVKLRDHLGGLTEKVTWFNAYDTKGRRHLDGKAESVAYCLELSGAENVFLCAMDEISSSCWRRAAFGLLPPPILRGRMGGIYHRPSFIMASGWSPNRLLKEAGFRRLLCNGWLRQVVLLDEFLARSCQMKYPNSPFFFLPDPCLNIYYDNSADARRRLEVPPDRRVFLFFGTGARRKGLHLAVEAFQKLPPDSPAFLLCVGRQTPDRLTAVGLKKLEAQNRARSINRYVSTTEEQLSFAACDIVLLPYVGHFGISAVLSQAMAANKPVIASDEQFLGRLLRKYKAGLLFRSGDAVALRQAIQNIIAAPNEDWERWQAATRSYAEHHNRAAFRSALLASLIFSR